MTGRGHPGATVILAVAVGGVVGTLARWLLVDVAPAPARSPVPGWAALVGVNLAGSFLLGWLTGLAARRSLPRWLVSGLGVGVLGSFTTLSAFVLAATLVVTGVHGGPLSTAGGLTAGAPDLLAALLSTAAAAAGVVVALAVGAALGTALAVVGLKAGGWRASQDVPPGPARGRGPEGLVGTPGDRP